MCRNKPVLHIIIVVLCVLPCAPVAHGDDQKAPGAANAKPVGPGAFFFNFYDTYISPIDGDRCGMYPTCSRYSAESIRKHGFLKGWIMTCDRLIRCGRDNRRSRPVVIKQKVRRFDPVDGNDFWWDKPTDEDD